MTEIPERRAVRIPMVRQKILSFLPNSDLVAFRSVSQEFRGACNRALQTRNNFSMTIRGDSELRRFSEEMASSDPSVLLPSRSSYVQLGHELAPFREWVAIFGPWIRALSLAWPPPAYPPGNQVYALVFRSALALESLTTINSPLHGGLDWSGVGALPRLKSLSMVEPLLGEPRAGFMDGLWEACSRTTTLRLQFHSNANSPAVELFAGFSRLVRLNELIVGVGSSWIWDGLLGTGIRVQKLTADCSSRGQSGNRALIPALQRFLTSQGSTLEVLRLIYRNLPFTFKLPPLPQLLALDFQSPGRHHISLSSRPTDFPALHTLGGGSVDLVWFLQTYSKAPLKFQSITRLGLDIPAEHSITDLEVDRRWASSLPNLKVLEIKIRAPQATGPILANFAGLVEELTLWVPRQDFNGGICGVVDPEPVLSLLDDTGSEAFLNAVATHMFERQAPSILDFDRLRRLSIGYWREGEGTGTGRQLFKLLTHFGLLGLPRLDQLSLFGVGLEVAEPELGLLQKLHRSLFLYGNGTVNDERRSPRPF